MKSELLLAFSLCATLLFSIFLVAADPVQNPFGATITIGNPGTTTTTTTQIIPINNPSNLTFQVIARDSSGQGQDANVSLYDNVNHNFLNNSHFVGLGNLYSSTSDADFELAYDNQNLDVMVNGLNVTTIGNSLVSITVENSNPHIANFVLYRAYHVELPWNSTNFNSITLKINLAGLGSVNYSSITVYRCGNYNIFTSVCTDSGGWQPQTISVDQAHQFVTLNINHFSVYAVGSGSGSSTTSTSSSTSSSSTSTYTYTTSTSSYAAPANNAPSSSGGYSGGGGGGGGGPASLPSTTSSTPTTTTTVLIVKRNDTTSSTSQTTQSAPITGFLSFSNMFNPFVIAAVIIVVSVVAVAWLKGSNSFPALPFGKMYSSHGAIKSYSKSKKRKSKSTELKLSL